MASEKEVRAQIGSIRNTQTITQAMKMVAASKMAKTQMCMKASRPYANTIHSVIGHITQGNLAYQHPYLETRDVKRVGYLLVSTDRGLCGGLNASLFKAILEAIHRWAEQDVATELALIGAKAISFFNTLTIPVLGQISGLGDNPLLSDLIGVVNLSLTAYDERRWDRLYLVYNKFVNALNQQVQIEQLLPLPKADGGNVPVENWDYLYEPDPKILLNTLLSRFIESQVYQGVVENLACEQAARMVAMQAATENASKLLDERKGLYNRKRQASITQELSEIIAGATAV